ncbi:single-stranded DNA-binding protein [Akkermansiaceae bacterium]|nr:single-stranded DNA-binding protein [Akkermansiaceae bacterium]
MANVNKVILIGRITRDIELRYTPKGTAVSELSMAVNRFRSDDSGQRIEETTFVEVTLWGKQAELGHQYLAKGKEVYIEGRLQLDTWQDKQTGANRSKLRVIGETMQFLGSNNSSGGTSYTKQATPQQNTSQPTQAPKSSPPQTGGSPADIPFEEEDDIPF